MRITIALMFWANIALWAQVDTSYIELTPRDKTVQFHTTVKDFSVSGKFQDQEQILFRNNNIASGLYFKWGLAELFFAIPVEILNNAVINAPRAIGTGFGLNFYQNRFHYNYEFKYIQGFQDFQQIRKDRLATLANYNYFFYNKLSINYIDNDKFSLKSALRFNDRQLKSAGSFLLAMPITYHQGQAEGLQIQSYDRFNIVGVGVLGGYGYSYVLDRWSTSVLLKVGLDLRRLDFMSMVQYELIPAANFIMSSVYNWERFFIGISFNNYPEFASDSEVSYRMENWKLRMYVGRRFY